MSLVTFIIPSKGRATLANTLCSLYEQTHSDWNAIVCFDNVPHVVNCNGKITSIKTHEKLGEGHNSAGKVRNYAMQYALDKGIAGDYFAFVDDDDVILPEYVDNLWHIKRNTKAEIVIFKMMMPHIENDISILLTKIEGWYLPKEDKIIENQIGISFAFNSSLFPKLKFNPSSSEDFCFLNEASKEHSVYFSDYIGYIVWSLRPPGE